ncbi:hypothetical protein I6F35_02980 [Bradyrhizobium sp. BRP22]|uniref:hypothetical protein n=1 Tax=Bradyrhizobium sp. BRP22 TaxID=2793821 RepID=UPI001CD3E284|nr:hypothetical protein [Bradyrhizobium sp. BRP22]MCA1452179.1 hypothetical protein [Bradyrhizobium sp. BRP22]
MTSGITYTELLTALCCGDRCMRDGEHCHRHDFGGEADRVMRLLARAHHQRELDMSIAFQEAGSDDSEGDASCQ